MARGVNKVILVGNLGADPEVRYTPSGTCITSIRIATSESWKDKGTGEQQERTEWHRVEFFGKLAEIAGEYLKKGGQVYVEGKIRTDEYEKDGIKRYSTKVIGDEMQMLGSRGESSSSGEQRERQPAARGAPAPQRDARGSAPSRSGLTAPRQSAAAPSSDFDDDEIPF